MDFEQLRNVLIPIHAVGGSLVLLSGIVAMVLPKKPGLHRKVGLVYFSLMLFTVVVSVPVIIGTRNIFLGLLAVFSSYFVVFGFRTVRRKGRVERLNAVDWGVTFIMIGVSIGLIVLGILSATKQGQYAPIAIGLGSLGVVLAISHIRYYRRQKVPAYVWMGTHLSGMIASYIAAVTALSAVNFDPKFIPQWIIWLWPTVVGVPLIILWTRRVAAKFGGRKAESPVA